MDYSLEFPAEFHNRESQLGTRVIDADRVVLCSQQASVVSA